MDIGGKFPIQVSPIQTKTLICLRWSCEQDCLSKDSKSEIHSRICGFRCDRVLVVGPVDWSLKTTKCGLDKPHSDKGPLREDRLWAQGAAAQAPKLLPLQTESDYRQARGQAGHWKHRHEQTIRYYLKESSAFQRKMVPLSVTLTIGSSTWHWISHLRRMNTATHSCVLTKIMTALFSLLFNTYKGKFMRP